MKINETLLAKAAVEARKHAYAPYSKYLVGAAVLCPSGKVYSGANIENASYGLTVCAERNAIFKAIYEGEKEILAIALCVGAQVPVPCGACRQVIAEFTKKDIPVILTRVDKNGKITKTKKKFSYFFPHPFKLK